MFTLLFCLQISLVLSQWEALYTVNDGPSPRRGHSLVTYTDEHNSDILILFGGRSQSFANCSYLDNWNYTACGDHHDSKLVDSTIVLSSSDPSYPNCSLNCSGNGWCHFDETISDSYCICFDDYRGDNCQIREFQEYKYDLWYLNLTTLEWTEYDFVDRSNYSYSDDWPWPSHRYEHSAIIQNDVMIIFGGYGPKCLDYCDDIWIWNITNNDNHKNKWIRKHQNNATLPNNGTGGERWQHTAFLSKNNNFMYVFGGHRYGKYMNDVVQLDLNTFTWTLMNDTQNTVLPPSRLGHAYTTYVTNQTVNDIGYIHGGYHSTPYLHDENDYHFTDNETYWIRDLWKLEINASTNSVHWTNITFHGLNETDPVDEILTELNRWYEIPFPRTDHNIMHIPNSSVILLFGGCSAGEWFNDLWRFDLNSQKWIEHQPPYFYNISNSSNGSIASRSGHEWTYSSAMNAIILFGGYGNENKILGVTKHTDYYNDLWILKLNGCQGNEENNECHQNNGHGICKYQFCFCNENYWGIGCEYNMCPDSQCSYNNHTWLPQCIFCHGNGVCDNGTCVCYDGYTGDGCAELECLNNCTNNGICMEISSGTVECVCDDGYESDDCSLLSCSNDCTDRGTCDYSTGICDCDEPSETGREFSSPDCALTVLKSFSIRQSQHTVFDTFWQIIVQAMVLTVLIL